MTSWPPFPGRWLLLFWLLLAGGAGAAEPAPLPLHFSAAIGNELFGGYRVELHGDTLTYQTFGPGYERRKKSTIKPKAPAWRQFRAALDDLNVWQWKAEYPRASGEPEGTHWLLDVAYANHALASEGDNNFPDNEGRPDRQPYPTKAFLRFLEAVRQLLGGKDFK